MMRNCVGKGEVFMAEFVTLCSVAAARDVSDPDCFNALLTIEMLSD